MANGQVYAALGGAALGALAGAAYGSGKGGSGQILYGMGGLILGAVAGGAAGSLIKEAAAPNTTTSAPPSVGAGALQSYRGGAQYATVEEALNASFPCGSGWRELPRENPSSIAFPFPPTELLGAINVLGGGYVRVWRGLNRMYAIQGLPASLGQWTWRAFMCDAIQQTQQPLPAFQSYQKQRPYLQAFRPSNGAINAQLF